MMRPEPKMIDAPGVLWGDPRDYKWTAAAKPDGLLVGLIHNVASPTGTRVTYRVERDLVA
jgi:hypothetical protein